MSQLRDSFPQYTVNSVQSVNKVNPTVNSTQYTVVQVRDFVLSLDKRVVVNHDYLPFYCKAARQLGFSRMLELQSMVTNDPRIDTPSKFCAERVFWSLIKSEMQRGKYARM